MATGKPTTPPILRNGRRRKVPDPLKSGGIARSTTCGADFLFPTRGLAFSHLDTVNITYRSGLANPVLLCWCGTPGRATLKFRADNVSPFDGNALVSLNFASDDPCWFELTSDAGDCRDASETFLLSPGLRASATPPLAARTVAAVDSQESDSRGDSFSAGAKAALGIGIALSCIAIGAMAAFLYFRRRRGAQAGNVAGGMGNHAGCGGRKGPEKKRKKGAASDASGHSDEPLCPIQPVFDGYPGSTGYDDVRSLHSTVHSHSPTGAQSPTHSQSGGFWTHERSIEREELTAARLRSQLQASAPTVVSYGPNPVTPTLMPRTQPRLNVNSAASPISPGSTDQMPYVSHYTDYSSYSLPPPSVMSDPNPSPPRKPAVPAVVSYGPNKVTPTPQVVSPTVPPDESIVKRRFAEAAAAQSAASNERKFSWEADSPLLGVSMGPLPPYASSEEFEAMEKGAVRKLAEPQAEAELPPTKDGFYHYTSDTVEYELPGAAPQHEPQLPFRPYLQHAHAQAGPSSIGGGGGGRTNRVIDEQKFLLSDAEISRMRAEKAARGDTAAAPAVRAMEEEEGESYDLGDARSRR